MTFAERLKKARGKRSQSEAARCLEDMPVRTLQEWEQKRSEPPEWEQRIVLAWLSQR